MSETGHLKVLGVCGVEAGRVAQDEGRHQGARLRSAIGDCSPQPSADPLHEAKAPRRALHHDR
jgi:hypothetical protein